MFAPVGLRRFDDSRGRSRALGGFGRRWSSSSSRPCHRTNRARARASTRLGWNTLKPRRYLPATYGRSILGEAVPSRRRAAVRAEGCRCRRHVLL